MSFTSARPSDELNKKGEDARKAIAQVRELPRAAQDARDDRAARDALLRLVDASGLFRANHVTRKIPNGEGGVKRAER